MKNAIIVLGNPPNDDGTIPFNLKARLDKAIQEYFAIPQGKLILTGGAAHSQLIEAIEMKKYCLDKGIPEDDILLETKANNTYDNALYTAEILRGRNIEKVVIVTSRFHKKRANIIFNHYFENYRISIPKLTIQYLFRNIHIYLWEMYQTAKLIIKGDKRLDRKVKEYSI